MAYLQKSIVTHVSEEELSRRWDRLSSKARRRIFLYAATGHDTDLCEKAVSMELGYLSKRCMELTVQRVVIALSAM
jgi:hypothetical protein